MATERVQIIVTSKGTVTVKKEVQDVGKAAKGAASGVDLLRSALGGLAAYVGVGAIIKYADTFTNIQNRLKLVTSGTEELTAATDKLYQMAQNTYQSYEATATIFARTANATKELGLSNKVAMKFTDQLSKSVALSGVSAESANAALIQFSQGLASGTLRGEELNSLLEQLPYAARALADGLGVSIGKLRELGKDGALTPKMIIDAFNKMSKSIDNDFANLVPTVSMGLQTIENGMIRLLGYLESNTGAFGLLAQALTFVGNNMEYVAIAAAPLALGLGVLAARTVVLAGVSGLLSLVVGLKIAATALVTARNAVLAFNLALLANPVTLIVVAITAVVGALALFGVRILQVMGLWDDFKKAAVDAINVVLAYMEKFLNFVTGGKWELQIIDDGASDAIIKAGKETGKHWMDTFNKGGLYANDQINKALVNGGGRLKGSLDTSFTTGSVKLKTGIEEGTVSFTDAVLQTFKEIGEWFTGWFDQWFTDGAEKLKQTTATANNNSANAMKTAVEKGGATAGARMKTSVEEGGKTAAMAVSEQGNNLAKKIAGAGDTAGQKMASAVSSGGNTAATAINNSFNVGGKRAADTIERAIDRAASRIKQITNSLDGRKGVQFYDERGKVERFEDSDIDIVDPRAFAKGGQFRVGGSGGTDSQMVNFRASPNERVTVETPAQQRQTDAVKAAAAGPGGQGPVKNEIKSYVVLDPNAMVDIMATKKGGDVFMQFVTLNRDALRSKLGVR